MRQIGPRLVDALDSGPCQVSPITMYNTEYNEERRQLVAVNHSYICYSLRQGHVRVLNKLSAARYVIFPVPLSPSPEGTKLPCLPPPGAESLRTPPPPLPCPNRALHKAHSQAVTDLSLFSEDVNLIASAGKDRAVHVYRVSEAPDADSITISPIVTFREPVSSDEDKATEGSNNMTVNWHPVLQVQPPLPLPSPPPAVASPPPVALSSLPLLPCRKPDSLLSLSLSASPHPQDVVAYTAGSSVMVCNLEGRSEEVHEVAPGSAPEGVARLSLGSPVWNASFSPGGDSSRPLPPERPRTDQWTLSQRPSRPSFSRLLPSPLVAPAGNMLAVATEDGNVHLWSLKDPSSGSAIVQGLKDAPEPVSVFQPYSPDSPTRVMWISLLPKVRRVGPHQPPPPAALPSLLLLLLLLLPLISCLCWPPCQVKGQVLFTAGPVERDLCLWMVDDQGWHLAQPCSALPGCSLIVQSTECRL